jgi:NAD-dependent dihydropyrimidine dehydrogenase PreA subunit
MVHTIKIDLGKCTGCKKCYNACFVDVFRWDEKSKRPYAKYPEECATCNWCEIQCPVGAIEVVPNNPVKIPEPYPKTFYRKSYVEK